MTGLTRAEIGSKLTVHCDNKLLPYQQARHNGYNLVIEIAGMPKSFKTTLALSTVVNMKTKSVNAKRIRRRPPLSLDKGKDPIYYTLWYPHQTIPDLLYEKKKREVILLDRAVYDRIAFFYAYMKSKLITKKDLI